jgi:hypothetical protein
LVLEAGSRSCSTPGYQAAEGGHGTRLGPSLYRPARGAASDSDRKDARHRPGARAVAFPRAAAHDRPAARAQLLTNGVRIPQNDRRVA